MLGFPQQEKKQTRSHKKFAVRQANSVQMCPINIFTTGRVGPLKRLNGLNMNVLLWLCRCNDQNSKLKFYIFFKAGCAVPQFYSP